MAVKSSSDQNEKTRRAKFQDTPKTTSVSNKVVPNQGGTAGRQLVPGLLLVQQDSKGEILGDYKSKLFCGVNENDQKYFS